MAVSPLSLIGMQTINDLRLKKHAKNYFYFVTSTVIKFYKLQHLKNRENMCDILYDIYTYI